jgi:hypothetical protein
MKLFGIDPLAWGVRFRVEDGLLYIEPNPGAFLTKPPPARKKAAQGSAAKGEPDRRSQPTHSFPTALSTQIVNQR